MSKTTHGVQCFVKDGKGRLTRGRFIECASADEARSTAERKVAWGACAGAAAFARQNHGDEFDDGSEPITLAVYGAVPPGIADQIPF